MNPSPIPIAVGHPPCHQTLPEAVGAYCLLEQHGEQRAEAQSYIGRRFAQAFGCQLRGFMPRLFTLRDLHGNIQGALGLRRADDRLFLEQYLDTPVEQALLHRTGEHCDRRLIVEVGHLSGSFPGAARALIQELARVLSGEGFQWVAFTGTLALRNAFARMGLAPIELAQASDDRLALDQRAAWGSYYQQSPRVFVGDIRHGQRALVALARTGAWA